MKRVSVLALLLAAVSMVLPVGVAFAQQPPVPVPVLEKRFQATAPSVPYDEVLLVLDIAPGAETPTHSHGGSVFLSVLEGTLWERSGGHETILNAGDTLMEEPGRVHAAGNSGSVNTRLLVTVLLPKGAALTTVQGTGEATNLPPGPTVVAQAILETPQAPATLDVVQRVTDLPAGAIVAQHTHPGPNFNILLQGQIVFNMQGADHSFKAGDSWEEPPNVVHGASNTGSMTARAVGAALVPRGGPVATPAQQPGATPPATVPGPVAGQTAPAAPTRPAAGQPAQVPAQLPRTGELPAPAIPVLLLGIGFLLGGDLMRRCRRHRASPLLYPDLYVAGVEPVTDDRPRLDYYLLARLFDAWPDGTPYLTDVKATRQELLAHRQPLASYLAEIRAN